MFFQISCAHNSNLSYLNPLLLLDRPTWHVPPADVVLVHGEEAAQDDVAGHAAGELHDAVVVGAAEAQGDQQEEEEQEEGRHRGKRLEREK